MRTFHELPSLLVEGTLLALHRHHVFHLGNIVRRTTLFLECLPHLQQRDALQVKKTTRNHQIP
jgi:hypothetical protein